jgi:hypothetical protein
MKERHFEFCFRETWWCIRSHIVVRIAKSRCLGRVKHVAKVEHTRFAGAILSEKRRGRRPLEDRELD